MTDSKPGTGTEWPVKQPTDETTDEPTTGGETYGGTTKQPERVTGQTGGLAENKPGPDQDEAEPRQEFPGEQPGTIGNRGPDPAEDEDPNEPDTDDPDTNAASPNAGQPQNKDQGNEHSTGS